MIFNDNALVVARIKSYPDEASRSLLTLRQLIIQTARGMSNKGVLSEEFKWGEPSYLTKDGSTLRIDWKAKTPSSIFIYLNCQTSLIETFRELHSESLSFSGNRAIELTIARPFPLKELVHCIEITLNYHKLKHLPLLGC